MGFSVEGCKKALINTGNNNIEAAMNWVFEHQSDSDFDTPNQLSTSIVSLKIENKLFIFSYSSI
jgi:ubiquitin carboxyl-terminal hydrolase 5/13